MRNPFRATTERMQRRGEDGAAYYRGAGQTRLLYDMVMGTLSANQAMRGSIRVIRNRARELTTKNSHASRIPQIFGENVIGENGVTYTAAVRIGEEFDERVNQELERAWYTWCEAKHASVDRSLSWPEIETLITESEVVDGEILLRKVPGFDNPFGFAIDILDPDQLDHTLDRPATREANAIVMGVEVDRWGAPVAYWLHSNHPSEGFGTGRIRVPADEIIHRFIRRRPRQARGISWLAPAVIDLSMHGGWREAHLVASRTASAKMGFFEHDETADVSDDDDDDASTLPLEGSAGIIERLPKGVKFSAWDPTFPSTNFAEFDQSILHSIASGARISYMSISGDLTKTSYGSGRIGLLAEQAVYKWLQRRHIERTSMPVHAAWLAQALLTGALRLPVRDIERYRAATWHPKPQPWLAPQDDLNVRLAKRRAGLLSLFDIAAEEGNDLEDQFRKIKRERELAEKYDITLDLSPTSQAARPLVGADESTPAQPGTQGAEETARLRLLGGI